MPARVEHKGPSAHDKEQRELRKPIDLGAVYQPSPGQATVHASPALVKVLEAARRFGKGRTAEFELLRVYLEEAPKQPVSGAVVPPFHAWVVVPSFPQSRQTWSELLTFIPPQLIQPNGVKQDDMIILLRGITNPATGEVSRAYGQIEVKSAHNPQALQTVGLDYLWVSECQDIDEVAFEKLLPTLRSPERMGRALFEGIPPLHAEHWFHRLGESAKPRADGTPQRKGYAYFHYTYLDNPYLSAEQIADIDADRDLVTDATWRRMYLAEFSKNAGGLKNIDACIAGDVMPLPIPGKRYVAGLDLGRLQDATVLHIFDAAERRVVFHRRWDEHENWVVQRETIEHLCKKVWQVERIVIDATGMGGDIFASELLNKGLPVQEFVITAATREPLLNKLAVAMERETVHFPPVASLLRELRAMQPKKVANRYWRLDAPPGYHDDEVFALALGLEGCDPPQDTTWSATGRPSSRRYAPTQAEADGAGIRSETYRLRHDARMERISERARAAGVL